MCSVYCKPSGASETSSTAREADAPGRTSIEAVWLKDVAAFLNVSVTATVLPPLGAPAHTVTTTGWPPTGNVSLEHRWTGCASAGAMLAARSARTATKVRMSGQRIRRVGRCASRSLTGCVYPEYPGVPYRPKI